MRKNKLILLILSILFLLTTVNANECFFKTQDNLCQRIQTGYNQFELDDLSNNPEFEKFEIQIYNKQNPENQLNYELENFNIKQISPFLESGVYTIKVKAYLRNNDYIEKKFDFIYDNTDLMPPIIPINLQTTYSVLDIKGKAIPNSQIIADYNSQEKIADVLEDGSFTIKIDSLIEENINYVKFYTRKNGKKSQIVERIIQTQIFEPKNSNDVTTIDLDDLVSLNEKTILNGNEIYTTKRNFYVQGKISSSTAEEGKVIFVNGQKVIAKSHGKFGAFVILNDGLNKITIQSGNVKKTYNVNFLDLEFQFTDLEFNKLVQESKVNIKGMTNLDYPFQVFLNGNFYGEFVPNSKSFDFTITDLNEGKNFVELRGVNNEYYNLIIYYDTQAPKVNFLSQINLAKADKLVFEITDDLGINLNSVKLNINNKILTGEYLEIKDNLFSFDISSLDLGEYEFTLVGEDLVGKTFSQEGIININKENTVIEDIYFDGSLIGNKIFVKSGKQTLSLIPSKNIAFKSIFLDGVEQTDYEILRSGKVRLNLNVVEESGKIHFNFINKDYQEFSEAYEYYSDNEKPQINLDYIKKPFSVNKIRISGVIKDSNFDWSSLKLNNQNSYLKFGNYFEALIDVENLGKDNLEISGYDYSKNSLNKNLGSILFNDNTKTNLEKDKSQDSINLSFKGSLYDNDESLIGNYNYISSFDGFNFNKLYLSADNFELPINEIYGVRSLNLKGFEGSDKSFDSFEIFKIEQLNDFSSVSLIDSNEIYLMNFNSKTKLGKAVIQGYVTTNILKSVNINGGNCKYYDNSFVCVVSLVDGINEFRLNVEDLNGKSNFKNIEIEKLKSNLNVEINDIFGDGILKNSGTYYMIGNDVKLDGVLNNKANLKILLDGQEIQLGDKQGNFKLDLDLSQETNSIESKEINLQLKAVDENGFESFSNVVKVIYKRVFETFARVIVQ